MIGTEESREVESTYHQAMSEAPPAYKELPGEDLVAELAKMKAMMEQMRLEKDRVEMEAKRKAEEEEMRELKLLQEEITKKNHIEMITQDPVTKEFFQTFKSSEEIILWYHYSIGDGGYRSNRIPMFMTNKHVYRMEYAKINSYICPWSFKYATPIYTFSEQLSLKYTKLISSLCDLSISLWDLSINNIFGGMEDIQINNVHSARKFESVIRLIPGSYQNGPWRQLDGIFGLYFNEDTMEVSEMPPPSL